LECAPPFLESALPFLESALPFLESALPSLESAMFSQSEKRSMPFSRKERRMSTPKFPKYRKHRASKQAVVTLSGRDHYLGPHGTKASHIPDDRLIA